MNYIGVCLCKRIRFDTVINTYAVGSGMYMGLGFVVYGGMVVFMERVKLTSVLMVYNNDNDVKRNEYEEREKLLLENDDNKELHI